MEAAGVDRCSCPTKAGRDGRRRTRESRMPEDRPRRHARRVRADLPDSERMGAAVGQCKRDVGGRSGKEGLHQRRGWPGVASGIMRIRPRLSLIERCNLAYWPKKTIRSSYLDGDPPWAAPDQKMIARSPA